MTVLRRLISAGPDADAGDYLLRRGAPHADRAGDEGAGILLTPGASRPPWWAECHGAVLAMPALPGAGRHRPVHGAGRDGGRAPVRVHAAHVLAAQRPAVPPRAVDGAAGAHAVSRPRRLLRPRRRPQRAHVQAPRGHVPASAAEPGPGGAGRVAGDSVVRRAPRGGLEGPHGFQPARAQVARRVPRAAVLRGVGTRLL